MEIDACRAHKRPRRTKNSAVGTLHDLRRLLGRGQDGRWCGAPINKIAHAIDDFPSFEAFGALARLAECVIRAIDQARRASLACIPNPFYPRLMSSYRGHSFFFPFLFLTARLLVALSPVRDFVASRQIFVRRCQTAETWLNSTGAYVSAVRADEPRRV